jgi:hypothetical protein
MGSSPQGRIATLKDEEVLASKTPLLDQFGRDLTELARMFASLLK